jgi:hypothetical protein
MDSLYSVELILVIISFSQGLLLCTEWFNQLGILEVTGEQIFRENFRA